MLGCPGHLAPALDPIEKVGGHGLAGLDLDRQGGAIPLDHHIDFVSARVAPEIKALFLTSMDVVLDQFRNDEALENTASHGMQMEVLGVTDPEEVAEEAGVGKIELRAFDQSLVEIAEMRSEEHHQECRGR